MIKLTDKITGTGPLYEKLKAECSVYKGIPSALFYESGNSCLGIIDGNLTVAGEPDPEELKEFLKFLSPKSIFCEAGTAKTLGLDSTECLVMRASPIEKGEKYPLAEAKDVYALLKNGEDGDISLPDYEAFLLDYSLRCRRGAGYGIIVKNSVCVASAVTDASVIISGVATDKNSRGNGFALLAVRAMRKHFEDKECFVFCSEKNSEFYKKCGFAKRGTLARSNI